MLFQGGAGHSLKQFLLDLCESKEAYTLTTEIESSLRQMVTQPPAVHVDNINNTLESVDTLLIAYTSTIMQLEDFIDSSFYKLLGLVRRNSDNNYLESTENSTPIRQCINRVRPHRGSNFTVKLFPESR